MRQDGLVQHVGVGHHQVGVQADRRARIARRIAVEGVAAQSEAAGAVELQQFRHLVLGQGLGREQEQGLGLRLHRRRDHRQRVAQAFAGSGRRDHHQMFAGARGGPGFGLVAVELVHAAGAQGRGQCGRQVVGQRRIAALARRQHHVAGDALAVFGLQARGELAAVAGQGGAGRIGGRTGFEREHLAVAAGKGGAGHGRDRAGADLLCRPNPSQTLRPGLKMRPRATWDTMPP